MRNDSVWVEWTDAWDDILVDICMYNVHNVGTMYLLYCTACYEKQFIGELVGKL
jgi:hypothetical protein